MKLITLKDGKKIITDKTDTVYLWQIVSDYMGDQFADMLFSVSFETELEERIQKLEDYAEDLEYSADAYTAALHSAQEEIDSIIYKLKVCQRINKSKLLSDLERISTNINSNL